MNYVRSSFQIWPGSGDGWSDNWDRIFGKKNEENTNEGVSGSQSTANKVAEGDQVNSEPRQPQQDVPAAPGASERRR